MIQSTSQVLVGLDPARWDKLYENDADDLPDVIYIPGPTTPHKTDTLIVGNTLFFRGDVPESILCLRDMVVAFGNG